MAKKEKAGHRQRLRERFLAGEAGSVYVIFRPAALPDKAKVTGEVGTKLGLSEDQVQIIQNLVEDKAITELMNLIGRRNRTKFRDQALRPLIDDGLIEMAIPDRPRSSKQKYRLTAKGLAVVQSSKFESSRSGGDRGED